METRAPRCKLRAATTQARRSTIQPRVARSAMPGANGRTSASTIETCIATTKMGVRTMEKRIPSDRSFVLDLETLFFTNDHLVFTVKMSSSTMQQHIFSFKTRVSRLPPAVLDAKMRMG
jgi:hypothetical protein